MLRLLARGGAAVLAVAVGSCSYMLPSFNNPLNPEIREVAIAHVANGVKCAMAAFLKDRKLNLQKVVDAQKNEGWRVCRDKDLTPTHPDCKRCPAGQWYGVKEEKRNEGKFNEYVHYSRDCVAIPAPNSPARVWEKFEAGRRFALDRNKKAAVEISLNATNTGRIDYTRINRNDLHLGPLTQLIVAGNSIDPFPSLSAAAKATNTVVVSFAIEQKIDFPEKAKKPTEDKQKKAAQPANPSQVMSNISSDRQKDPQALQAAPKESTEGGNRVLNIFGPDEFESECATDETFILGKLTKNPNDKRTYVDYLGIKKLLNKLLDDVERDIYTGTPELALDQLTLTSQFQLTLEASAGTYHILRIVPVVVPPTVRLTPDRTHQLKITLKGAQNSVYKDNVKDLVELCLNNLGRDEESTRYCKNPGARQIQTLIDKLDGQKSATSQ